ncbi:chaperonin Cpn60/TCP-1 family, partial [Kipferlia bialata]
SATEMGVYDGYTAKDWAMRMACDAACTVLRIDMVIMLKQSGGPAPRTGNQN